MRLKVEVWAWTCLCAVLIAVNLEPGFGPHLSNDAYQYLSVAQNTRAGHFGYTSLVHYDPERSFGRVPAPMVHFPLGYPLAIVFVSLFGVSLQTAALLVSALSVIACVPLLAWIATRLGLSRLLMNAVIAGFVFNARVLEFGASALSEAPFMFVVLAGVALVISARLQTDLRRAWWRWVAAGLAFGAAYWVRYAGMFFVVGLAALFIRHLLVANRSLAKGYAVTGSLAGAAMLVGIARNIILVGNWQGTVDKKVSNPLLSVLVDTVRAGKVLFLGPTYDMPGWSAIARVLFIASFFGAMAWLIWRFLGSAARRNASKALKSIPADLLLLTLAYCGCMFYAGLTTTISYEARMFVPLTPLFLLLLALALTALLRSLAVGLAVLCEPSEREVGLAVLCEPFPGSEPRRAQSDAPYRENANARDDLSSPVHHGISPKLALAALGASFGCYVLLNLAMVVRPPADYSPPSLAAFVDSPSHDGKTPRAAVYALVDPTRVLVANYGQAVGHVLERPTVSLVGQEFSPVEWNEKAIHDVVDRFNAAAIVIYANTNFLPSAFVRRLARGEAPSWMKLAYRSSEFLVYQPLSRTAQLNRPLQMSQGPVVQR